MSKIVSLDAVRRLRKAENQAKMDDTAYQAKILSLSKLELLEEMVRFQEKRSQAGKLNLEMMIQGQILFKALEETTETQDLKTLSRAYRRHLIHELQEYTKMTS